MNQSKMKWLKILEVFLNFKMIIRSLKESVPFIVTFISNMKVMVTEMDNWNYHWTIS